LSCVISRIAVLVMPGLDPGIHPKKTGFFEQ
jgi:hypothetical protein